MTTPPLTTVVSADGTPIAVESIGRGDPVVLVAGAFGDRTTTRVLAERLAAGFTVHAYDRRGRGDSGDGGPYAVARECEDLTAVLDHAGGAPRVYGHSTGGILALEAAAHGAPVGRLAVYEAMFPRGVTGDANADLGRRLTALVKAGNGDDAVATFFTEAIGLPAGAVAGMRNAPMWPHLAAFAPTLAHETALTGDEGVPTARLATITAPVLALDGGDSGDEARSVMDVVAAAVPGARRGTLPGQDHAVDQSALADVLAGFFA